MKNILLIFLFCSCQNPTHKVVDVKKEQKIVAQYQYMNEDMKILEQDFLSLFKKNKFNPPISKNIEILIILDSMNNYQYYRSNTKFYPYIDNYLRTKKYFVDNTEDTLYLSTESLDALMNGKTEYVLDKPAKIDYRTLSLHINFINKDEIFIVCVCKKIP